jgi:hypothetical protein
MSHLKLINIATLVPLLLLPQIAFSQIYKCKSPTGKTIYSESICPSGTQGSQMELDSNIIDNSSLRNKILQNKNYAKSNTSQPTSSSNNRALKNFMTSYDRELRLREVMIDINGDSPFYEKKADAKNEYSYLEKKDIHSLSYESEVKRRNFKIDLSSPDSPKRTNALRQLSIIYLEYK